jgi:inosine triphosphate pyrophosphatase
MTEITIVTGNPGKLQEWQALLPKQSQLKFVIHKLDLPEIQSMDLQAIVKDKLERAYQILKKPVIVEDVSAGLDNLHGLPGPFFKFFEEMLGPTALLQLAQKPGQPATIICTIGYFDGHKMLFSDGSVHATVVEPRGTNGFGFDSVILVDGQTKTNAELTADEKNRISHRGQAIAKILTKLQ